MCVVSYFGVFLCVCVCVFITSCVCLCVCDCGIITWFMCLHMCVIIAWCLYVHVCLCVCGKQLYVIDSEPRRESLNLKNYTRLQTAL